MTISLEQNGAISEFQLVFTSGYSTLNNIFTLFNTVNLKVSRKYKQFYSCFMDLKAAFDLIDGRALIYKLSKKGVSTKLLNVIKNLYSGTKVAFWGKEG